jgi:hypothetical protein
VVQEVVLGFVQDGRLFRLRRHAAFAKPPAGRESGRHGNHVNSLCRLKYNARGAATDVSQH